MQEWLLKHGLFQNLPLGERLLCKSVELGGVGRLGDSAPLVEARQASWYNGVHEPGTLACQLDSREKAKISHDCHH